MAAPSNSAAKMDVATGEPQLTAWRWHFQWLVICGGIIIASAALELRPSGLSLPGLPSLVLPGMCVTRTVFHVNCPGCGMTRSFVAMAHGELELAFRLHRLGPLLFVLVLAQIPLRAYTILTGRLPPLLDNSRVGRWMGGFLVLAIFANWLYNIITGAAFCAP